MSPIAEQRVHILHVSFVILTVAVEVLTTAANYCSSSIAILLAIAVATAVNYCCTVIAAMLTVGKVLAYKSCLRCI